MSPAAEALAQYGILGLLLAVSLAWIKRLQDRIEELHAARADDARAHREALGALQAERVADARAYGERALVISERVHETTARLGELLDHIRGD